MKTFVTEEKLGGGKPICMTWDEQGRLWLALSYDYPNELQKDGEGRDKIVICEDTDGDGVCDTVTTFAEKLSIPTSILNVHGGLIVLSAPHTLFLKDTDGDGKADVPQGPLHRLGHPRHARRAEQPPLRLRQLDLRHVRLQRVQRHRRRRVRSIRQGLYRFKLESGPRRSPNSNSSAAPTTTLGASASTRTANCSAAPRTAARSSTCTIPNRYYEKVRGLTPSALANIVYDNHIEPVVKEYRQVDWHGGFTAACGLRNLHRPHLSARSTGTRSRS